MAKAFRRVEAYFFNTIQIIDEEFFLANLNIYYNLLYVRFRT